MLSPLVKVELETHILTSDRLKEYRGWRLQYGKCCFKVVPIVLFIQTSIIYSRDYRNLQTGFSPIALEPPWTLAAKQQSNTPVPRGDLETFACPDVLLVE
jgi:hypothetical protein